MAIGADVGFDINSATSSLAYDASRGEPWGPVSQGMVIFI
eukprot:gene7960-42487_t